MSRPAPTPADQLEAARERAAAIGEHPWAAMFLSLACALTVKPKAPQTQQNQGSEAVEPATIGALNAVAPAVLDTPRGLASPTEEDQQ